jgi:hypothetical protein
VSIGSRQRNLDLAIAGHGQRRDGIRQDGMEVDRASVEGRRTRLEVREVAHLHQEGRQPRARFLGFLQQAALLIVQRTRPVLEQHPYITGDHGHRGPEFVDRQRQQAWPLGVITLRDRHQAHSPTAPTPLSRERETVE